MQINGVEQLGLKAKKWMLEAKQMKPGVLGGRNYVVFLPGIDFGVRTTNLAVVEIGQLPSQRISLFFVEPEGSIAIMGSLSSDNTQFLTSFGPRFHVSYLGDSKITGISCDMDVINAYLPDVDLEKWISTLKSSAVVVDPKQKSCIKSRLIELVIFFQDHPNPLNDIILNDIHESLCMMTCEYLENIFNDNRNRKTTYNRRVALLNKALAFIHSQDIRNVTIKAVVGHVHSSLRNIEYTFQEHFGTSLKSYLVKLRLNAIRHTLLHAATHSMTVTSVTREYGVVNLGRFSSDYRAFFGEYPRESLKRRTSHA